MQIVRNCCARRTGEQRVEGEAEGEELKKEERRTGLTGGRGGEGEPGEGGEGEGGQQVDANQVEICVNPQGMTEKDAGFPDERAKFVSRLKIRFR